MENKDGNSTGPLSYSQKLVSLLGSRDIHKIDDELERLLNSTDDSGLLNEIANSALSTEEFELLSLSTAWPLLASLATNPSLPIEILRRILASSNVGIYQYEVQQSVLTCHVAPQEIRDSILKGKEPGLWSHLDDSEIARRREVLERSVVENFYGSVSELASLATWLCYENNVISAEEIWIRKYGNPPTDALTPFETIENYSWEELKSFATHPMTSRENLVKLSFSDDEELEALVASNPSTPPCIIAYFVESLDANLEPPSLALANPAVPSYVWPWFLEVSEHYSDEEEAHQLLLQTAASSHGLPEEMMERLMQHPSMIVRENLKNNVCLPDHLKKLI